MPDATNDRDPRCDGGRRPPRTWNEAFAWLPAEDPPVDGWRRAAASLDARRRTRPATSWARRRRTGGWLALAAILALVVVGPWQRLVPPGLTPGTSGATATTAGAVPADATTAPALAELHAESALLETLLAHARDDRVASGSAAAMTADLEARLAAIDAALAQPGLGPARERALWAERVQALRALASFEGTRRWLAVNGEQYDGVLVQVN